MNRKSFFKTTLMRTAFVVAALFSFCAFADPPAAQTQSVSANVFHALREQLDSLEMEMQANKRIDKPTDELEAQAAKIRDSLSNMREHIAAGDYFESQDGARDEKKSILDRMTSFIPENILSFRPKNAFDWIIVGTGAAALISIFMLIIGIAVSGKKKSKNKKSSMPVARKMNLAVPKTTTIKTIDERMEEEARAIFNSHSEPDAQKEATENLQSLISHLRELAPDGPPSPPPAPQPAQPPSPPPFVPPIATTPPTPPAPPPPLFVTAPEFSDAPPPPEQAAGNINETVIAAATSGMSEQEISKRYHVSIDQVRLILRMNKM